MSLPQPLTTAIQEALDTQILKSSAVGGGDISQAARATLADGRNVLIKWNAGALPGLFTAEWRGLALLASANTLRVPAVLAHREPGDNSPGFIVLEWLGRGASSDEVAAALGRGLAAIHRVTAGSYGLLDARHDQDCFAHHGTQAINLRPINLIEHIDGFFSQNRVISNGGIILR